MCVRLKKTATDNILSISTVRTQPTLTTTRRKMLLGPFLKLQWGQTPVGGVVCQYALWLGMMTVTATEVVPDTPASAEQGLIGKHRFRGW